VRRNIMLSRGVEQSFENVARPGRFVSLDFSGIRSKKAPPLAGQAAESETIPVPNPFSECTEPKSVPNPSAYRTEREGVP